MNRYQVEYKEYGELVFQGKLTMEELQRFMVFIDDKRMKMIENGESDRQYLEKILDELESKPLNEYEMRITETKEDGDYRHVQIMIDIIETELGRNR